MCEQKVKTGQIVLYFNKTIYRNIVLYNIIYSKDIFPRTSIIKKQSCYNNIVIIRAR